jgi:hypothetical protein
MHWRDCPAETLAWFQLRELLSMMAVMARAIEHVLHLVNPNINRLVNHQLLSLFR